MKASELIKLYQQGRRNFSREDLSGENFDGQQLSDINLSYADIRGASFVNANLTGANFTCVREYRFQVFSIRKHLFLSGKIS